jgi:hypothetical protein
MSPQLRGRGSTSSDPRCTLRLRSRAVGPLHCLVLRGPGGTLVRRWSPDTRLNGSAFTDAPLLPGDCLNVGPIDLEVVATGQTASSPIPAGDAAAEEFAAAQRDFEHLRRQFEEQRQAWKSQRAETQQLSDQQAKELDAREARATAERLALEQDRRQLDAQRTEAQQQIAERAERLDALQAELEGREESLQRRRQQWEAERLAAESPPAEPPAAVPAAEPPAQPEPAQEPEFLEPSDHAPVDLAEVFGKIGAETLLRDDEPEEGSAAPPAVQAIPAAEQVPQPRQPDHPAKGGEEESIDDYMTRLLERVRSTTGGAEVPDSRPQAPRPQRPAVPTAPAETPLELASVPQPATPRPRKPVEMTPRAKAPEKMAGLSAMRELANLSAQNALDQHTRKQLARARRGKLLIVISGLAAAALLMWMWSTYGLGAVTYFAAMVGIVVALFWGLQYAILTGHLIISRSGRLRWKSAASLKGDGPAPEQAQSAAASGIEDATSGSDVSPPAREGDPR